MLGVDCARLRILDRRAGWHLYRRPRAPGKIFGSGSRAGAS